MIISILFIFHRIDINSIPMKIRIRSNIINRYEKSDKIPNGWDRAWHDRW